jgi:diguanylate cyclase (GGDEF)-like protein
MAEMLRAVNAVVEPEAVAECLVDRVAEFVPANCFALVVSVQDAPQAPTAMVERGVTAGVAPAVHGIAQWVLQHGEVFATGDLREDYRVGGLVEASVIAFPLSSRGRTFGALVALDQAASRREPQLPAAALASLQLVLDMGAIALENALALKRAVALSITDDLTGLFNSRYLNQVLRRETKMAARTGRPLSLLFVDLDGFKRINDTYGHLFGSRALVEAAAVIRGSARETDVAARYGGDEFALVLPETSGEGSLFVARRLRERIAAHRFLAADRLHIELTASIGIATMPEVANTPEALVQAADKAMYRVKESGKDGIRLASE